MKKIVIPCDFVFAIKELLKLKTRRKSRNHVTYSEFMETVEFIKLDPQLYLDFLHLNVIINNMYFYGSLLRLNGENAYSLISERDKLASEVKFKISQLTHRLNFLYLKQYTIQQNCLGPNVVRENYDFFLNHERQIENGNIKKLATLLYEDNFLSSEIEEIGKKVGPVRPKYEKIFDHVKKIRFFYNFHEDPLAGIETLWDGIPKTNNPKQIQKIMSPLVNALSYSQILEIMSVFVAYLSLKYDENAIQTSTSKVFYGLPTIMCDPTSVVVSPDGQIYNRQALYVILSFLLSFANI